MSRRHLCRLAPGPASSPALLDERGRPDFRDVYSREAGRALALDAALTRIRLSALDLDAGELGRLERIRVVLAEVNALSLAAEAAALAARPGGGERLGFLVRGLEGGTLAVRLAPLAGWAPDFSVFHPRPGGEAVLFLGLHRLERPYPHPGPAFASVHRGADAARAGVRFRELWERAHDLRAPLLRTLRGATARGPAGVDIPGGSGYSFVPSEGAVSGPVSEPDPA
jgi:hypothetical protein